MGEGTVDSKSEMNLGVSFIKTRNSYVVHLDVLGMSALIKRDIDRAWLVLCDLKEACANETLSMTKESRCLLEEYFFSDTIILISDDDSVASLHTIIARSLEIFREAYAEGIPLRGAIAHGEMVSHRETAMFTGKALLSAYQLGERQQSLTICLDDKTAKDFHDNPFSFINGECVVFDYKLEVKEKEKVQRKTSHLLNWFSLCEDFTNGCSIGENVYSRFSNGEHYQNLAAGVKRKYENTCELISYVTSISKCKTLPKV